MNTIFKNYMIIVISMQITANLLTDLLHLEREQQNITNSREKGFNKKKSRFGNDLRDVTALFCNDCTVHYKMIKKYRYAYHLQIIVPNLAVCMLNLKVEN